ncbi:phosphotransferase [Spiroplasma chrysopicola]|uniref:Putative choline kinase n=1 Tax=Spiroplasma chrysopicola DF-1 TaxID=1276227 RepID=R4UFN4_9MOLU|nr:phosphotransferase [Spiroplasma chrysopicola]AGM24975.1 putative choline kinase [Spiroplasma chrysopicola DF-1]
MKYKCWKKLALGITNQNYLTNNNLFVRYSLPDTAFYLDHQNEIKVLEALKTTPWTIPIVDYGFEENNFYLVSHYLTNSTTIDANNLTPSLLKEASTLLKNLWAIKIDNDVVFNPKQFLNNFKVKIKTPLVDLTGYEKTIDYQKLATPTKDLVLCHNDLNPGNFLISKNKMYLIDFEYAMYNDRLFDIGSFISETLTKQEDINLWLTFFDLSPQEKEKLAAWINYQNILWIYWATYMYQERQNPIFYDIILAKYQKLKQEGQRF